MFHVEHFTLAFKKCGTSIRHTTQGKTKSKMNQKYIETKKQST